MNTLPTTPQPFPPHDLHCGLAPPLVAGGAVLDLISADHSEVIREDLDRGLDCVCVCACVWALRGDTSAPSTITFLVVGAVTDTICGTAASQDAQDYAVGSQSLALMVFGKSLNWATCSTGCLAQRLTHPPSASGRVLFTEMRGYLFNHTFTCRCRNAHLFAHPCRHANTRRPINLLFDSGFNLLSASPLAGPASQLSGNKEAGVWWKAQTGGSTIKAGLSAFEPWCSCTFVQAPERRMC